MVPNSTHQYMKILNQQSQQSIQKWLSSHKITSYMIRNEKSMQVITTSIHVLEKMLMKNQLDESNQFMTILATQCRSSNKIIQYCKLLKHFSFRDYQFEFLLDVATNNATIQQIALYLRIRNQIVNSMINKFKKYNLTSISAQLQQWFKIIKSIFKRFKEKQLTELFTKGVKDYYVSIKKDQNINLNGAEFFKISQIISQNTYNNQITNESNSVSPQIHKVFDDSILNGLKAEDRQLIRVLAYKDNNIAKILQEKHNKMIALIGEEVQQLRNKIEEQKQNHIQLIQSKNNLIKTSERMKQLIIQYIVDPNQANEEKLLSHIYNFSKEYQTTTKQIDDIREIAKNRRLISIIEKQEAIIER